MRSTKLINLGALSIAYLFVSTTAVATTTENGSVFTIDTGTAFSIGNVGSSNFTFTWNDPQSGAFTDKSDPTLVLTVGETYTFQRVTGFHPFVIMGNTAADFISGGDGSFRRTTTNSSSIGAAVLSPNGDFTADPGPTSDLISWSVSENEVGTYWYTCSVTSHTGMTGKIQVVSAVPEPASSALLLGVAVALIRLNRRRP